MSTIGEVLEQSEAGLREAVNKFNEAQEYRVAQQCQSLLSQIGGLYTHIRDCKPDGELLKTEV